MMDCHTCQLSLDDYLEEVLSAHQRTALETHLSACPNCQRELATAQRLEAVLYARPLKMPPSDFTQRVLARTRAEKAPVAAIGQTIPALAYAASLAALLFGFRQWLDSSIWGYLSEGVTQVLDRIRPREAPLISGEPFSIGDVLSGTYQNLAGRMDLFDAWPISAPDSLTVVQPIGLVEASAAVMLIAAAWVLCMFISDRDSGLMTD